MGRGPSLKTELKKLKKKIEAKVKTQWKLQSKKPIEVSIREHLGKLIDRTDVPKTVAILGMTILVKTVIDQSEELRGKILEISQAPFPFASARFISQYFPFFTPFERVAESIVTKGPIEKPLQYEGMFPDVLDWLIAFTLAYIIVENFGDIMNAVGNITSSVKGLVSALLLGGGVAS